MHNFRPFLVSIYRNICRKKYTSGPRYWNVPVLVNTGTFLVYQYCPKMWYLRSLEHAGVIQKLTILEHKNGLVLSNTHVPVSGTWSIHFPFWGAQGYSSPPTQNIEEAQPPEHPPPWFLSLCHNSPPTLTSSGCESASPATLLSALTFRSTIPSLVGLIGNDTVMPSLAGIFADITCIKNGWNRFR